MANIVAYVGESLKSGSGIDCELYSRNALNDWGGNRIGTCYLSNSWRVNSYIGTRMFQIYAWVDGKEYTGRGFGRGMAVVLRETAHSKRNPQGIDANGKPLQIRESA